MPYTSVPVTTCNTFLTPPSQVIFLMLALRSSIFALSHLHLALALRLPASVVLTRSLPCALCVSLGGLYLAWGCYKSVLTPALGFAFYQEPGSPLVNCLQLYAHTADCSWDINGNMARLTGRANISLPKSSSGPTGSYGNGDANDRYGSQYASYDYGAEIAATAAYQNQ